MSDFLLYEQDGSVVTLTMNQPEQRNPLTGNTAIPEFLAAIERIHDDRSVRCVILAANGPSFCAGGNIHEMKRQALPAYDPRAVKAVGVTYATTPMGADHTAGYGVCQNILSVGGAIDPLKKENNVEISKDLQIATAAIDAAGLCLFVAFPVLDHPEGLQLIVDMLNAQYGLGLSTDDVGKLGISILKDELEFNRRAGFTKKDDRLPDMFKETFPPHNTTWDFTGEELDKATSF